MGIISLSTVFKATLVIAAGTLLYDESKWVLIQITRSLPLPISINSQANVLENSIFHRWVATSSRGDILPIPRITSLDELSLADITKPFIVSGLSSNEVFSLKAILSPPLSEIPVDYFTDARLPNMVVPDSRALLGDIVQNITRGGTEKIGTQKIVEAAPSILRSLIDENSHWLGTVFTPERVNRWKQLGLLITAPVFISRGQSSALSATTRTDLHSEPIANLVFQTLGSKKWTLVSPEHYRLLKPIVSPDGRAYFYSNLDPLDPEALSHVPRYEVVTTPGDALFVPCWTWHRVEYIPNVTATSVSIFEFNPSEWIQNNPVFAFAVIPNMIKEIVGLKFQ